MAVVVVVAVAINYISACCCCNESLNKLKCDCVLILFCLAATDLFCAIAMLKAETLTLPSSLDLFLSFKVFAFVSHLALC